MIIITVFAFLFLLLLSYGVYLLSLINKDLSDNKVLPDYVKNNVKLVGSLSTVTGLLGLIYIAYLGFGKVKRYNSQNYSESRLDPFDIAYEGPEPWVYSSNSGESDKNFGFKFY